MALVALDGTPLVIIGAIREGGVVTGGMNNTTLDATNESIHMIGRVFTEDGGSHTIDTTGSSSLGWRSGSVTFANAGTTVIVGLAAVDASTGPPGRAANASDVVTVDVSRSITGGGGGITANAWQEHVPTSGTKTIANGDLVAFVVQMTARGGADSVVNQCPVNSAASALTRPFNTSFTGGSYAGTAGTPNAVITFSDGTYGFFFGGEVTSTANNTQTWNNTSGTKEYGNYFLMPFPAKVYGIAANVSVGGDTDLILYSGPLGTPVAEKTASIDLNQIGVASNGRWHVEMFSSPYSATTSQPLAAIIKPTSATNITAVFNTLNVSGHMKAYPFGTNGYAVNRNSGSFAAQNSNKDRFAIGLIVGAFDSGGSIGVSRARAASGF